MISIHNETLSDIPFFDVGGIQADILGFPASASEVNVTNFLVCHGLPGWFGDQDSGFCDEHVVGVALLLAHGENGGDR